LNLSFNPSRFLNFAGYGKNRPPIEKMRPFMRTLTENIRSLIEKMRPQNIVFLQLLREGIFFKISRRMRSHDDLLWRSHEIFIKSKMHNQIKYPASSLYFLNEPVSKIII
jgi:hypothetical protein